MGGWAPGESGRRPWRTWESTTGPTRWIFGGLGSLGKNGTVTQFRILSHLVDQFMDRLGIAQAPLVGHSMGGTVSLSVAIKYPGTGQPGDGDRLPN